LFLHLNLFANTFVLFSNNSHDSFNINSEHLDQDTNLVENNEYDLVKNKNSSPFLPNLTTLRFNSNVHIQKDRKYHFKVSMQNESYPGQDIHFFITTVGKFSGSKIIETKIQFPSGQFLTLDPQKNDSFSIFEWNNLMMHFVPYNRKDSGITWPSFNLSVDENQDDNFDFSTSNTFKAMTYNIQIFPFYGDVVSLPNNKRERAYRLPTLIGDQQDVVSLNEVFDRDLRNHIIADMSSMYPYHIEPPGMNEPNFLSGGVLVFSKWPILTAKEHVYKNCSMEECMANKGIIYIKLQKSINGIVQNYNVFSTHVQAFKNPLETQEYYQSRTRQIRELKEFINQQNISEDEPVFVTGDLNIDKYDPTLSDYHGSTLQTEYEYLLSELDATDPAQVGLKYSFDANINTMLIGHSNERGRLDYVLYLNKHKAPLNAVNYVRTMRDTWNPAMYPSYDTSDHFPVIGAFIF